MSNALKLSDSHVERGLTSNPQYKKYEDKLRQIKNQDGEVDIAELCQVLDEASTIEKHRKLLKGACWVLAVFSLLTIAAIVGLTYAVVDLTKDSQVSSSNILVTKNSAANHVATGRALLFDDAGQLFNKSLEDLSDLKFLILPGGKTGAGTVVHVAQVELDPNTSAKVTTTAGAVYEIDASGIHLVNKTSGGRRKLLQVGSSAMAGSTSSTVPPAPLAATPTPAPVGNLVGSPAPLSPTPTPVGSPAPLPPIPTTPPTTPLVGSPPPLQTSGVATSGSNSSSPDLGHSNPPPCSDCSCATPQSPAPDGGIDWTYSGCGNTTCKVTDTSVTGCSGAETCVTYNGDSTGICQTTRMTCCEIQAACLPENGVSFGIVTNSQSGSTCACLTTTQYGGEYVLANSTCVNGAGQYSNYPYCDSQNRSPGC